MPFTFAHPAIVIPLSRGRFTLSLTALAAGSIVPDFEFFFQMKLGENLGHHWQGIFLFDLPVGVFICFLFHNLIRNTFIDCLPNWYRIRFTDAKNFDWNRYATKHIPSLLATLLLGILSHLLWDGFTHEDGLFVQWIPILNENVYGINIPLYSTLQVVCSVWGLWMVHRFIATMPVMAHTALPVTKSNHYWIWLAVISLFIFSIRVLTLPDPKKIMELVFACIGSVLYAWTIVSVVYKKKNNQLTAATSKNWINK